MKKTSLTPKGKKESGAPSSTKQDASSKAPQTNKNSIETKKFSKDTIVNNKSTENARKNNQTQPIERKDDNRTQRKEEIKDPRFAKVMTDPRFKKFRSKEFKVKVDDRFKDMLNNPDFQDYATHDPRGKKVKTTPREKLEKFYEAEDNESADDSDVGSESEEDEPKTFQTPLYSSSEDEEDVDAEEEEEEDDEDVEDIPVGDATNKIAIMNCDWDHVKAVDLFKLAQSFVTDGVIKSVTIYPSDFGLERMKEEEINGPRIWKDANSAKNTKEEDSDEDDNEESQFDQEKLRQYELDKLKYYFAVLECDSVKTAMRIYENIDGMEFEHSSNMLDLRYIPDDISFDNRTPRERCTDVPLKYSAPDFNTKALQQTKVDCTWDTTTDRDRKKLAKGQFTKDQLKEMDFKTYLASSSDEDNSSSEDDDDNNNIDQQQEEEDEEEEEEQVKQPEKSKKKQPVENGGATKKKVNEKLEKKKEKLRNKYKALLDLVNPAEQEAEEMEITFTSGLAEKAEELIKKKKEEETTANETVFETAMRKKRERKKEMKKQRREQQKTGDQGEDEEEDLDHYADDAGVELDDDMKEMMEEEDQQQGRKKKSTSNNNKKKGKPTEEELKQKAELELIALPENLSEDSQTIKKKGYNLKSLIVEHSGSKRQKKKLEKKGHQTDEFEVDVKDSRWEAMFTNPNYQVDPTNPHFKNTAGTQSILKEKVRRRHEAISKDEQAAVDTKSNKGLQSLVESVKKKSATNFPQTKKQKTNN